MVVQAALPKRGSFFQDMAVQATFAKQNMVVQAALPNSELCSMPCAWKTDTEAERGETEGAQSPTSRHQRGRRTNLKDKWKGRNRHERR